MKYTNIFEKFICLVNVTSLNWICIVFLFVALFFLTLLGVRLISRKTCFMFILISYFMVLGVNIFNYQSELGKIGSNLIERLFTDIYFPSAYVYLFVLIVLDVTAFANLMDFKKSDVSKGVHGLFFFMMQFVFTLILEIISKNHIDIFSKASLFSNKDLVMLLELSINIFIGWILTNLFVYFTNLITDRVRREKVSEIEDVRSGDMPLVLADVPVNGEDVTSDFDTNVSYQDSFAFADGYAVNMTEVDNNSNISLVNSDGSVDDVNSDLSLDVDDSTLVENVSVASANNFDLNDLVPQESEVIIPEPVNSEVVFEPILNNSLVDSNTDDETSHYTLNDYRLFNKILKDIKDYNNSNTVTIDKDLEYRLITKYSTETYHMFQKMLKIYSN